MSRLTLCQTLGYQLLQGQIIGLCEHILPCLPPSVFLPDTFFPLSFLCSWNLVPFGLISYYVSLAQACFVEDFCSQQKEWGTWEEWSYLTTFALISLWTSCAQMWWFCQSSRFAVRKVREDRLGIRRRRSRKAWVLDDMAELSEKKVRRSYLWVLAAHNHLSHDLNHS